MKVCWISAGVSSFIAGVLGNADLWIYIDVANQHPDSLRFIEDCEHAIGKKIEVLSSPYFEDIEDVFRKKKLINTPYGAPCTTVLKKKVRRNWENEFISKYGIEEYHNLIYIWGFDSNEQNRADRVVENFTEVHHEFPLIEKHMTKESVHGYFESHYDFKRPIMYDMGYQNNNCIGCVKGGMGYWNKIRKDFPDVFESRCKLERELGCTIINGMYLDELPPDKGNPGKEIMPECDILCYLADK